MAHFLAVMELYDASIKFYTRYLVAFNRNITDRDFALAIEIGTEREHICRCTHLLAAGGRHIDRFEIESGRLDLLVGRQWPLHVPTTTKIRRLWPWVIP